MERLELIQELIERRNFKTYLEIGVLGGYNFFKVKCRNKIAVDPHFRFNWKGKVGEILRNGANLRASYYEMKSDDFFSQHARKLFEKKPIDVALIDGMHELDFVLRDVDNILRYLADDGVIVLHDCNPVLEEAACSFSEWKARGFTGHWNGDVWKCVAYLNSNRPDINIFVGDCDHGLGVITKEPRKLPESTLSLETVRALTYKDLDKDRSRLLNLKTCEELMNFVKRK